MSSRNTLDLFGPAPKTAAPESGWPLAERLRPATLDQIVGQSHLIGPEGTLSRMLERGASPRSSSGARPASARPPSPACSPQPPACTSSRSRPSSPAWPTSRPSRPPAAAARPAQRTLLFVDEIHRFNRAQQDGFLPFVEDGTIVLVGATTENPSFELNGALLSRAQVLVLSRLDEAALDHAPRTAPRPSRPAAAARRRRPRSALRHGRRRRALRAQHGRAAARLAARRAALDAAGLAELHQPPRRALRQGARGALQPDLRAAQVDARLRPGRGPLLARAHARRRRGPAATSPAASSASPPRTSASPTRKRSSRPSPPGTPTSASARPRASSPSPRPSSISARAPKSNALYTRLQRRREPRQADRLA